MGRNSVSAILTRQFTGNESVRLKLIHSDTNYEPRGAFREVMRLRSMFVAFHGLFLVTALFIYLLSHGGIHGDYVYIPGNDVVDELADVGQVFFNRWHFTPSQETWVVQVFFYLNLPSFACGTWIAIPLVSLADPGVSFPFGLSLLSYCFLAALPLTFVQWYWIGRLAEYLVKK